MNTTTTNNTTKTTITIVSVMELIMILAKITKSTIFSLSYLVDESKSRTINKAKALQKHVTISNAYLNHSYGNKVNAYLKKAFKEGLVTKEDLINKFNFDITKDVFVPKELKGKIRMNSNVLMSEKTEKFLLDAKIPKNAKRDSNYFHNGEAISFEDAKAQDLFAPSFFTKATSMGRGLLPDELNFGIINTAIEKIDTITLNGNTYKVDATK